jgi:membrane associated rhomboid family serine protease
VIPLADELATRQAPVVGRTLLVLCLLVFLWQVFGGPWAKLAPAALGLAPAAFFAGGPNDPLLAWVPFPVTLVTYLFLHGGWLHLAGNALYLWVFGSAVESVLGKPGFLAFFLFTGAVAALAQAAQDPASTAAVIGASGAISGVLGAYLVFFPRAQLQVLAPVLVFMDVVRLPAWLVLVFWFLVQLLYDQTGATGGDVAFRAHVAGFVAGMVVAVALRRRLAPHAAVAYAPAGRLLR